MRRKYFILAVVVLSSALTFHGVKAHEWMAPESEAARKNPHALQAGSVESGRMVYSAHCVVCHGDKLEGLEAENAGLEMDAPNLKQRLSTHSDGDFFYKIREGRGDMPAFKDTLTETQIWEVINYIRSETN